jgi:RimJ/RimL family protein N-acetyltransferase
MHNADSVVIRSTVQADTAGIHRALGIVARERLYLRFTDAPPVDQSLDFIRGNIAAGNPQFVAEHEAEIIGWCDIVRSPYEAERHCGTMGMGLLPACRDRGIGHRLLAATLTAADASGFIRIELTVNADNPRAIRLYQNLGFVEEGRKRHARLREGRYGDVLVMGRVRGMVSA